MRSHSLIARPAKLLTLSLLALATPRAFAAQIAATDSSLTPGTRVRVVLARSSSSAPTGASRDARREVAYVGTLIDATSRSVVLRPDRSADTVEIARDSIARTQVSLGRSRGGRMAKGFLIGGVFGVGFGLAVGEDCSQNDFICFDRGETVPMAAMAFGAVGALVGAITWRERWRDAPRISVVPSLTGGLSMSAELRF